MPQTRPYVVIAGSGRSGTNRMLDAFDLHPRTVCRSEVEEMPGGDFAALPGAGNAHDVTTPLGEDFEVRWAQAVARARRRQSDRDRIDALDKDFYAGRPLARPVQKLLARGRLRREVLGRLAPRFRAAEWPRPLFCADAEALDASLLALKIRPPRWLTRTHAGDPAQIVVHQIREPRAYLNSWRNRWVGEGGGGAERVHRATMAVLPPILAEYGEDAARLDPFSEETLIEGQLWLWRHMNETLFLGLRGSPRYRLVTYDAFDRAPAETLAELLALAGLPATPEVLARVGAMQNTLFKPRGKAQLDSDLRERAIARVLHDSPLPELLARD